MNIEYDRTPMSVKAGALVVAIVRKRISGKSSPRIERDFHYSGKMIWPLISKVPLVEGTPVSG